MVIQRWQSVFLLIAAVLMGIFPFTSFGVGFLAGEELTLSGMTYPATAVTSLAACALLLIDIFLFKNLSLQKRVIGVSILLMVVTLGLVIWFNLAAATNGFTVLWTTGCYLLIAALVMTVLALRCIRRDERLLRSYDRLR